MVNRPVGPWLAVVALTATLTAVTTHQALARYKEFRSGWSWDLAYYNQWFWAMTRGDGMLTVRPVSAYAIDGPSVWKMNYLAPIRFALAPIYAFWPDPRTLLVVNSAIFWLMIPAAYTLVRSESKSEAVALSAMALAPLTPLAWPLALNDFRELQLAIPFVLWAIQGWRERRPRVAAVGIVGMLACRQEYALVVASLSMLSAREPESAGTRQTWTVVAIAVGLGWFILVFLGYLSWRLGPHGPADYLTQFAAQTPSSAGTIGDVLDVLLVGLGSWVALALLAPRLALLAVPWVWSVASGRWTLQAIATIDWHHVRYAAPMTALLLAAGLVGYARLASFLSRRFQRPYAWAALWSLSLAGLLAGNVVLQARFARVPRPISAAEADRIWTWIAAVGPEDGVLAGYEVTAPLSSRRWLYSYRLAENRPPGYPRLASEIRWAFVKKGEVFPKIFLDQGFVEVSPGPSIQVFRRKSDK